MRLVLAATLLLTSAGLVRAEADLSTFRPMPRPFVEVVPPAAAIHPLPRPDVVAGAAPATMIRPMPRPEFSAPSLVIAAPTLQTPTAPAPKGALCQRADLKGRALAPIRAANSGCNVPDAVLISQVAGVKLSPPATINCEEAVALSTWITEGLQPAFNNTIAILRVVDSYSCRGRNNVRGAKMSVHGLGQAIDISGFVTDTGRTYTVSEDYNAQIKAAQRAGCGTFHTILGPGSDGYHEDHIHFDVAHHRGDYCH
ncbi:MAG: extensin family protein [Cypionkella sp.]